MWKCPALDLGYETVEEKPAPCLSGGTIWYSVRAFSRCWVLKMMRRIMLVYKQKYNLHFLGIIQLPELSPCAPPSPPFDHGCPAELPQFLQDIHRFLPSEMVRVAIALALFPLGREGAATNAPPAYTHSRWMGTPNGPGPIESFPHMYMSHIHIYTYVRNSRWI